MFCNIVPDDVLKKIKDKHSLEISQLIREQREELLANREVLPIPKDSEEIRVLYHGQHNERLDQNEKYILSISQEIDSVADKPDIEDLQLFDNVYDFYKNELGRKSYDNHNAVWKVFKYVGDKYNNAFWNGQVFAFGDGDQVIFRTFMIQNVVTHEAMHAITEHLAGLIYQGQSGALNESISDVFAICIDQKLGTNPHWIIGEGVFTSNVNARGLRTMTLEPAYDDPILGTDNQPKHMRDFYSGREDNYGVHINSGIPNHAFYAFCKRSGKNSWEEPMRIWYNALPLTQPYDNFQTFANNTVKVASGELKEHLIDAWKDVGIQTEITIKKNWSDSILYFIKWFLSIFRR